MTGPTGAEAVVIYAIIAIPVLVAAWFLWGLWRDE